MILFRPVGLEELRLVYESEMRAFPPRLPDQPIFYPVTNQGYATQIARDWNTKSGSLAGFVTRFAVADEYASKFERRVVGGREHEELWVPAEELAAFNQHLDGTIGVIAAYFGAAYRGCVPEGFGLRGKDASAQFLALARTRPYNAFDVTCELAMNHTAVFLNFFHWEQGDFAASGLSDADRNRVLGELKVAWESGEHAAIPLGVAP